MCTVTIVPKHSADAGWRMACSRDELRSRDAARPPQSVAIQGIQALTPIDPSSGGTWVGVNQAGLAITLLNYNPPNPPTDRESSRGSVIPLLLGATSMEEVIASATTIQRERMMPFRLVACDGQRLIHWRSTEPIEDADDAAWNGSPMMYTSSGLGDHLVQGPRLELFKTWFGSDTSVYYEQQRTFHRHQWTGREHLSVCMQREDARTVSYTVVEVDPDRVTMTYHPDRPDTDAEQSIACLERRWVQR